MNTQRFVITTVVVFIVMFAFDFLVHGCLLKGMYEETSQLWRPQEEHKMFPMILSQFLTSAVIVFIFTRNYEGKGVGEGVKFGSYIGALLGAVQVGTYSYLPIPLALTGAWIVSAFVGSVVAGVMCALIYKN